VIAVSIGGAFDLARFLFSCGVKGHVACSLSLAAPLALCLAAMPAHAFDAEYGISLIGIPIGVASLDAQITGNTYRLEMQAKLTGLAGVLTGGKGGAVATGTLANARPLPATFAVTSATSDAKRTLRMALASGDVREVEIKPPLENWDTPDRVPVTIANKRGVVDPLSAILMPVLGRADDLRGACNRSIPVFDGATRFNVVLSYRETKTIETQGYKGPIAICGVRYVPIAGHRPQRAVTKFMEANREMEVALAPIGDKVFAPYRISIKTMVGTAVLEAVRFDAPDTAQAAVRPIRAGR
jgi:hypothetical protein